MCVIFPYLVSDGDEVSDPEHLVLYGGDELGLLGQQRRQLTRVGARSPL